MESREDCLHEAAECDRLAQLANTQGTRSLLAVAAFQWRKLAERAAERQKRSWPLMLDAARMNYETAKAVLVSSTAITRWRRGGAARSFRHACEAQSCRKSFYVFLRAHGRALPDVRYSRRRVELAVNLIRLSSVRNAPRHPE